MSEIMGDKIELRLKAPSRCRMLYEILLKGEVIGEIELDHIAWRNGEAELKIGISNPARQRQGYGTDAVSTLLEHAFVTMNLGRIYLRVHAANEIAVRCYEKAGFKKKGRLRRCIGEDMEEEILLMAICRDQFLQGKPSKAG